MTKFLTYDVFTNQKHSGNPLAIIPKAVDLSDLEMQKIAREFNLSETIFILPKQNDHYTVRIFTPAQELPFAGHPTIGASIAIARIEKGNDYKGQHKIVFIEKAGTVNISLNMDPKNGDYAEFIAPKTPVEGKLGLTNAQVAEILTLEETEIGFDGHIANLFDAGNAFFTFPIKSREALSRIEVNSSAAARHIQNKFARAFYCYTAGENSKTKFSTRMFSLDWSMNEDPATGSAATSFAGAVAKHLQLADGEHNFSLDQGVDMGRPSEIRLTIIMDSAQISQVRIGGYAVPISHGELY
ncbi:MAG: phenazine biosynthesis protein PhzF [Hyphomicrobiales bacterium]|nr:MAG: phenazine biosynthesis protein PhzF [Hyphomicrobiales bacterium]